MKGKRAGWIRAVSVGLLTGAAYAVTDEYLDTRPHVLGLALRALHEFIDIAAPLCIGALAGLLVYALRERNALLRASTSQSQELSERLDRVQRDQAVWLVAAATLHRVVTPLHTLGLLADDLPSGTDLGERIRLQIDRIVEELNAVRALQKSEPEMHQVLLDAIVVALLVRVRPFAERAGVQLRVDGGSPLVRADAHYVQVILENLVLNGIEAMPEGGTLRLELAHDKTTATISVHDEGTGVLPDRARQLFEPLRGSDKETGLGMGLPVSRAMARAMGGELRHVASDGPVDRIRDGRINNGAVFVLTLPLFTPAEAR